MKTAFILARVFGVLFGLLDLQSSLWFGAYSGAVLHVLYVASPTVALLAASLLSGQTLRLLLVRICVSLLIGVAAVRYFVAVLQGYRWVHGPDYVGIAFHVFILVVMVVLLLRVNWEGPKQATHNEKNKRPS